jgi:hypothetical protein
MAIDPDDYGTGGGGGGGGAGSGGAGGRTWVLDPTPDTLTFSSAPGNLVAIHVDEYDTSALVATDLWSIGAWNNAYGFPGEVEFYAARLWWARSREQPQTIWASEIENYYTHGFSVPSEDDDAITATINSRTHNAIRDLVPLQNLVVLSSGGAWKETTPQDAPITPSTVSFRPQTASPASTLPALMVDSSAIYCTAKGNQVRDLSYAFESDGFVGADLTAFSSHLVKYRQILDWDFLLTPWSAVLSVRDDGVLLSMTYKREHQVVGWSRLTTRGAFRSVVVVPEDDGDVAYAIVERTINGVVGEYIERMAEPTSAIYDWLGLDCSLSYDGRNTGATTVTLTGSVFDTETLLTMTASASAFAASNVGDVLVFGYGTEAMARIRISEFVSATVVRGYALSPIAAAWQATATTDWALAVDTLLGLAHLNGETVDVVGDGQILAQALVAGGSITLADPVVVAHVGLAYDCDLESLQINLAGAESVQGKQKIVRRVDVGVVDARNVRAGVDFDHLEPAKSRYREQWGREPDAKAGLLEYAISASWDPAGKVCIRAGGGLPATILTLTPHMGVGQ